MASIGGFFSSIGDWFGRLFNSFVQLVDAIEEIRTLVEKADAQWQEIKTQQFVTPSAWKTRVVQPAAVVEKLQSFREQLVNNFEEAFSKARAAITAIQFELQQLKQSKLDPELKKTRAISEVFGWVQTIILVIKNLRDSLDAFLQLTSVITDLKKEIESLELLFLSQAKPRTWERKRVQTRKP